MLRAIVLLASIAPLCAAPLADHAKEYRADFSNRILPYWLEAVDKTNGGYLLSDDAVKGRSTPRDKMLVSQARMVWTFSHVHARGFSDAKHDYLAAARTGYRFLVDHFRDKEQGGYFWRTDLAGKPTNERKILYGNSFVVYSIVEYYRASKDPEALDLARKLYAVIDRHAHDAKNRGWTEHFTRDWKPLALKDPAGEVEVAGYKSANTHLHYMEALTELFLATKDDNVKRSLEEALQLNKEYFYPKDAAKSAFHFQPDWSPVTDAKSAGLSYGHNIEFAWLMVAAEEALGRKPDWEHFRAHLDHTLAHGYDHERGGVYDRGVGNEPAKSTLKIWWVQAEAIAAFSDGLRTAPDKYRGPLDQTIHFVNAFQADKRDGVWLDTVTAEGQAKSNGKAHAWKANYHDVRALVKFITSVEARN